MMTEPAEDTAAPPPGDPEDIIGSSPGRLDTILTRMKSGLPESFGRTAVLTVAGLSALLGLVIGLLTAPADPVPVPAVGAATDAAALAGSGYDLLTLRDLIAIGEQASGGTYTRGSASALPDPCTTPAPGDEGVSYVPGPQGATAVSLRVTGGSVTERVTTLPDDAAARAEMRALVGRVRNCAVDSDLNVELATIGPGVGDEYVQAMVTAATRAAARARRRSCSSASTGCCGSSRSPGRTRRPPIPVSAAWPSR